jgi:hypothetical protein
MGVFIVVYGLEWIAIASLMIIFWKWTAEFIRVNLLSYPFWRYVIPKNLVVRRWFVVLFAICVIAFGLMLIFAHQEFGDIAHSSSNEGSVKPKISRV